MELIGNMNEIGLNNKWDLLVFLFGRFKIWGEEGRGGVLKVILLRIRFFLEDIVRLVLEILSKFFFVFY